MKTQIRVAETNVICLSFSCVTGSDCNIPVWLSQTGEVNGQVMTVVQLGGWFFGLWLASHFALSAVASMNLAMGGILA